MRRIGGARIGGGPTLDPDDPEYRLNLAFALFRREHAQLPLVEVRKQWGALGAMEQQLWVDRTWRRD